MKFCIVDASGPFTVLYRYIAHPYCGHVNIKAFRDSCITLSCFVKSTTRCLTALSCDALSSFGNSSWEQQTQNWGVFFIGNFNKQIQSDRSRLDFALVDFWLQLFLGQVISLEAWGFTYFFQDSRADRVWDGCMSVFNARFHLGFSSVLCRWYTASPQGDWCLSC